MPGRLPRLSGRRRLCVSLDARWRTPATPERGWLRAWRPFPDQDWTEQRGGGSRALLEDASTEQHRNKEEDGRARPSSIVPGRGGKRGKERNHDDASGRRSWPDTEPDELPPQTVFFDSRPQARRSEHAASNLEIPTVEVTASEDT